MSGTQDLVDDPSIPDTEGLYHSIHPLQVKDGGVSSGAFTSRNNPHPSVDRSSLTTPQATLSRHPHHVGVAQLSAAQARQCSDGVAPLPVEGNPAHAVIIRPKHWNDSEWKKAARTLARACTWAIAPTS